MAECLFSTNGGKPQHFPDLARTVFTSLSPPPLSYVDGNVGYTSFSLSGPSVGFK